MVAVRIQAWAAATAFPTRGGNLSGRKVTGGLESRWRPVDIILAPESPTPELSPVPGFVVFLYVQVPSLMSTHLLVNTVVPFEVCF